MGNNYSAGAATHLGNWSEYRASLEPAHRKIFETGFQFPRLAVQEPQGIMILRVGEIHEEYRCLKPNFNVKQMLN